MSIVFTPKEINGMSIPNRFVRSATWEGMAEADGACTRRIMDLIARLIKGGVGLIISGHTFVRKDGQAGPGQMGVYDDRLLPGLRELTKMAHDHGGKVLLQVTHAGCSANQKLSGQEAVAVSDAEGIAGGPFKVMTREDIQEIIEAFAMAALRAKEADFDGVQVHSAHAYLLSQFLSPRYNRRRDEYGGSIENRARTLLEIVRKVRAGAGRAFPVLVKMNCEDFLEDGLLLEDSVKVGAMLQDAGVDAIEVSGGTRASGALNPSRMGIHSEDKEAYFRDETKVFREALKIPLILVGGIRSLPVAEGIIKEGIADFLSMSRPLIREPGLVRRWQSGDLRRAMCISDNRCFEPARRGEGIYCIHERKNQ